MPSTLTWVSQPRPSVTIEDNDPVDPTLIDDFEGWHPYTAEGDVYSVVTELMAGEENSRPGQDMYEYVLTGEFDTTPARQLRPILHPTARLERLRRPQLLVLRFRQWRNRHGRTARQSGSHHRRHARRRVGDGLER